MKRFSAIFFAMLLLATFAVQAQQKPAGQSPKGFKAQFLRDLDNTEKKFVDLAGAIPPETYAWRPMEGVRSVSEVLVHVSLDNYMTPKFFGTNPPEGISDDLEKTVTDKDKAIDIVKRSFTFIRDAMNKLSEADLSKTTKGWGGRETTYQALFFGAANHIHEHLGQLIAYARMNKVVPPWTAKEQEAEKTKKKEGQ